MAEPRKIFDLPAGEKAGTEGRVPPQAVDVEMAVLGAMLLDKEAIAKALEVLDDAGVEAGRGSRRAVPKMSLRRERLPGLSPRGSVKTS